MQYKVGDEVFVKAKIKRVDETDTVRPYLVYIDAVLNNAWITADVLEETKTYEQGLADAWELAKQILYGIDKQLIEIFELNVKPAFFDLTHKRAIINDYTPEEALAKIEAYKKEKEGIKVGDVVTRTANGFNGIVTSIKNGEAHVMYDDGSTTVWSAKNLTKTGKHIDIESLLKEIGG